jgi:hypothetical protein
MAITTAARDSASFDREHVSVFEYFDDGFEDVVFEAHEFAWILSQVATEFRTGGRDVVLPISGVKNTDVGSFSGTDILPVSAPTGPAAAMWRYKNYRVSVMQLWEESVINSGEVATMDLFQHQLDVAKQSFQENINRAIKEGQANGSTEFEGLQDAVVANDHAVGTETFTRAQAFGQASSGSDEYNTYAGVDRTATNDTAIGWRNLSINMERFSAASTFGTASSVGKGMVGLKQAYQFLTRGATRPDLILMALTPYFDYEAYNENNLQFQGGGTMGDMAFPFEALKFRNAMVIPVEDLNPDATTGDAASGEEMIYILNTAFWKWTFESQAYFSWTDWIQPGNQLVRVAHNILRGALRCTGPRWQGVMYDYGS